MISSILFSNIQHTVTEGETLYRLAKDYGVSVQDIVSTNGIDDIKNIGIGTQIDIPDKKNRPLTHKVVKGDTLFSLSRKYNLSVSRILEYNNLKEEDVLLLGELVIVGKLTTDISPVVEVVTSIPEVIEESPEKPLLDVEALPFWPLAGDITDYSGRIKGVQILGTPGEYIKVVSPGKVIWYDSYKGIGKVVLIEGNNGYDYLYGTKESLNVRMGIDVAAGDKLGRLEDNNRSLIFSVFKNGKPLGDISKAPR